MKTNLHFTLRTTCYALAMTLLSTFTTFYMAQPTTVFAQGTAFTYQGQLQNNGSPASGTYNLTFTLFNTNTSGVLIAGPVTNNAVGVTNGLFTVLIDFGPGVFTGATNWLEIAVETNGVGSFTTLTPRQQLTPTPYAIYAESASGLSGTLSASQLTSNGNTNGNFGNFFVGAAGNSTTSGSDNTANGVNALYNNTSGSQNTADGYGALYNNTSGSQNTANGHYGLYHNTNGYDNTANGYFALINNTSGFDNTAIGVEALDHNTNGSYNIALGYQAGGLITTGSSNIDIGNVGLSTDTNIIRIGSLQTKTFVAGVINGNGGGLTNLSVSAASLTGTIPLAQLPVAVVTNGASDVNISGNISGNGGDLINLNASQLTSIGNTNGGLWNFFIGPSGNFTMSGSQNTANGYEALYSNTTGGWNTANGAWALFSNTTGSDNTANGYQALISNTNGYGNTANSAEALFANTSGNLNTANGFSALYRNTNGSYNTANGAQALQNNTSGAYNIALGYLAGNSITTGGYNIDIGNTGFSTDTNLIRIGTTQTATYLVGTVYANGVALTSDRNAKENFTAVNAREVLAKVASLPVTEWNFKTDSKDMHHIGPMAQDFQAAFQLGTDDKHISVVDEGGVALAAIQGLNQKVEEQRVELKQKETEVTELKQRLAALENIVLKQKSN
jgi:trimeric autotransporter adhesin